MWVLSASKPILQCHITKTTIAIPRTGWGPFFWTKTLPQDFNTKELEKWKNNSRMRSCLQLLGSQNIYEFQKFQILSQVGKMNNKMFKLHDIVQYNEPELVLDNWKINWKSLSICITVISTSCLWVSMMSYILGSRMLYSAEMGKVEEQPWDMHGKL